MRTLSYTENVDSGVQPWVANLGSDPKNCDETTGFILRQRSLPSYAMSAQLDRYYSVRGSVSF
jgi:hypothetical protein